MLEVDEEVDFAAEEELAPPDKATLVPLLPAGVDAVELREDDQPPQIGRER